MDVEGSVAYEQQQLELDEFDQTLSQAMDKMVSSKQVDSIISAIQL